MDGARLTQSEEDIIQMVAKTDSFWDIGNYKRVVKRIDEGARLCSDFVKMAQERAEIEAKYVKHLTHWAKKWEDLVVKGPEYGSLEIGWKATLKEATRIADVHVEIHRKIQDEIIESVQNWKSQHYHKSLMHLKETKKADDGFLRAQKPWVKRLQKTRRSKKVYHHAAREFEIQTNALQYAETSPECTGEQCAKLRDKCERAQRDLDKALGKYKERMGDLQHYKSRYEEDMNSQFAKCQDMERERLEFFKATLQTLKTTVDLSQDSRVVDIYHDYGETLSRVSPEDDLRWYSVTYGADMNYAWPEFEEYIPGGQQVSGKTSTLSHRRHHTHSNSPSLNGHQQRKSERSSGTSSASSSPALNTSRNYQPEEEHDGGDDWLEPPPMEDGSEDDSEEEPQGKLMRALYDYSGSQEDDLNFKEGDLLRIMYEGKDGWAEGLMGDKYGYVPISYLEAVRGVVV